MTIFNAFFDESGTHADAFCGYVSTVRRWKQFRREWESLLEREGLTVLHRVDIENLRGDFEGWTKDHQIAVLREGHSIIRKYTEMGIGAAVINADFDKFMPDVMKRAFGGPGRFIFYAVNWRETANLIRFMTEDCCAEMHTRFTASAGPPAPQILDTPGTGCCAEEQPAVPRIARRAAPKG